MAGQYSGSEEKGWREAGWRATDGRVIKDGDLLAPALPAAGPAGVAWVDADGSWMVTFAGSGGNFMCKLLHQWLLECGHRQGDDSFNVHIISNYVKEAPVE